MAYPTVTVATMISRVAHMLTNSSTASSALSTEIQWALEDTMNSLCLAADMAAFRKESTLTFTANTGDYELPEDFYRIIEPGLRFDGDPNWTLLWYDEQDFNRSEGHWRLRNSSRPRYYTLRGRDSVSGRWTLRITPKPDTTYLMILPYFSIPSRIATAATTDTLDRRFPPMFWRAVQFGAASQFPQYLTQEQIVVYKSEYDTALADIKRTDMPVSGRVHQMRRYDPSRSLSSATFGLTGTDIIDPSGAEV